MSFVRAIPLSPLPNVDTAGSVDPPPNSIAPGGVNVKGAHSTKGTKSSSQACLPFIILSNDQKKNKKGVFIYSLTPIHI